jgi:hypothetical protein
LAIEPTSAQATADQRLQAAHAAVKGAWDLQHDFTPPRQAPRLPHWLTDALQSLGFLEPMLKFVLWGALIAVAVLIVWLIAREFVDLPGRRKRRPAKAVSLQPDAAAAAALLDDAERLAEERKFGEAVHVLLSRSVDDINRRRPGAVRAALTGRDLCETPGIPDEPRGAFARLCGVVELSLFGGRAVDEALFARCRDDYRTFAFSEAW